MIGRRGKKRREELGKRRKQEIDEGREEKEE